MSTSVKELVRRYREELWNEGNLKVADEIIASDCRYHIYDPLTTVLGTGPERAMKAVVQFRSAFPDLHVTIEDLFAEGDRALVRWKPSAARSSASSHEAGRSSPRSRTSGSVRRVYFMAIWRFS